MTDDAAFAAGLRDAAEAAAGTGCATLDLAPAGVPIRVHLAPAALADLLGPALITASPAAEPAAEFWVVDGAGSGAALPALPWAAAEYLQREELRGWTEPPLLATVNRTYGTLSVADVERGYGVQWIRDAAGLASWEGGAPLRSLLRWTLARHDVHMLHAAVVGTAAGGVLLAGPGGSGKSTSALAALRAGMAFVADDYCLVHPGDVPMADPLYAIAKVDDRSLQLLASFQDRAADAVLDWRQKLRLPIEDAITDAMPLRAIILPHIGAATGTPVRLEREEALRRIIPPILFQLPGDAAATLRVIGELLERLPVYALEVGPDVDRIPPVLTALIEEQAVVA